jgi:acyl-CoA synthetase (AMP-forming)/AMP-acid ligase II
MRADCLTLPALLEHNGEQCGAKVAVVTHAGSLSHAQLDFKSTDLARQLVGAGVGRSSRVGLLMENGIEWVVIATAIMRVGAILVPLSTLLKPPELRAQLDTAKVTELVVTRQFRGRSYLSDLEAIAPGVMQLTAADVRHVEVPNLRRVWVADELPSHRVDEVIVAALGARVRPADDLVILFTSGSRSAPKGVIHTHGGAIRATAAGLVARCIGPDERFYIPMPFFWTGGFSSGLMTVLVAGATLITEAIPEPELTLSLLEREKVTLFRGWPDQAARLASDPMFVNADLSHLGPGSLPAVLPPDERPAAGSRANLFGMTETFGPYCGERLDTDLPTDKHGSCGRPFEGVEVRIFETDSGVECPAGVDGEIGVRGPNVMRAICGRTRTETFDGDGFYHTGDLGKLDTDGYLWYGGRRDDMFKVKGATVYPSEVEEALRGVHGVRQAFVTNVSGLDGEQVGAFVITRLTPDALDSAARASLSSFKVPSLWYVTDRMEEVPRLASDKVSKTALQDLIKQDGRRVGSGPDTERPMEKGTTE